VAPLSGITAHLLEKPDNRYQTADGVIYDCAWSFRSTGTLSRFVLEWKVCCDARPGLGRAVEADRADRITQASGDAAVPVPRNALEEVRPTAR
jgi:hypothetical protein